MKDSLLSFIKLILRFSLKVTLDIIYKNLSIVKIFAKKDFKSVLKYRNV